MERAAQCAGCCADGAADDGVGRRAAVVANPALTSARALFAAGSYDRLGRPLERLWCGVGHEVRTRPAGAAQAVGARLSAGRQVVLHRGCRRNGGPWSQRLPYAKLRYAKINMGHPLVHRVEVADL